MSQFKPNDSVVYRLSKFSRKPGRRAREIHPARHGDSYGYCVDKFWRVERVLADDRIEVRSRRGKLRELDANDPNLRRPAWWERLLYARKFPECKSD